MKKEKLRPLYSELQGYLAQAPSPEKSYEATDDESMWTQYNQSVNLLSKISGQDYNRFLIEPQTGNSGPFIRLVTYRQKLGGLISRLHGEYFAGEPAPFSVGPDTVITQSQQQYQSVHIQMLLEIQSEIDEKLRNYQEGSKEKNFLQKFKNSLSSVSNVVQLFNQLFKVAKGCNINIDDILKIFD